VFLRTQCDALRWAAGISTAAEVRIPEGETAPAGSGRGEALSRLLLTCCFPTGSPAAGAFCRLPGPVDILRTGE